MHSDTYARISLEMASMSVPDPTVIPILYYVSSGNVSRLIRNRCHNKTLRPTHPDKNVFLRFNWTPPCGSNPHNAKTIYYGSQFLHKSTDNEILGNHFPIYHKNTTKQHSNQPEDNFLYHWNWKIITILAIAPTNRSSNLVGNRWGNVQVDKDGGKTWTNLSFQLKGLPMILVPTDSASTYMQMKRG